MSKGVKLQAKFNYHRVSKKEEKILNKEKGKEKRKLNGLLKNKD